DEERNLDFSACLKSCRLCCICSCVALKSRVCLCYHKLNKVWWLYAENIALVRKDLANHVLFYKLKVVAENGFIYRDLLPCLCIHEIVEVAVFVAVLHISSLDISCW